VTSGAAAHAASRLRLTDADTGLVIEPEQGFRRQ
jgi:hypothetical protein